MNGFQQLKVMDRSILLRPAAGKEAIATLVLLHGYGADEYDLMGLASYFDPAIQVLSIRGGGTTPFGGASWFDIDMLADGSLKFNIDQARESTRALVDLLFELQAQKHIPTSTIVLGGFSQGATISNLVTLQNPDLIQALLIMSGRLPEHVRSFMPDPLIFKGLPVFAGHGTRDSVIPIQFGRDIVSFWKDMADLEHHEYPMGHEISQEELTHILHWLSRVLKMN